jgi:release factor glutamine methyltransferase
VPRPETEIVVERCLALLDGIDEPRVCDVGTGTGAIALALKHERPDARVTATDVSADALALARENAGDADVRFVEADLLDGVDGPFDLVVSNPPYVAPDDVDSLPPEVGEHEPRAALVESGATEAIAAEALNRLVPGGSLAFEVADGKAGPVAALLRELGYEEVTIGKDLAGRERVVDGRAPR